MKILKFQPRQLKIACVILAYEQGWYTRNPHIEF